jgi:ATP-binding cassette, subfamily C, bacterial LapB
MTKSQEKEKMHQDGLLQCLLYIAQTQNVHCSANSLLAGLPLENNCLTPSVFSEAASRAGFSSRIVKRSLKKIPKLLLPCLLLLNQNKCCVLLKKEDNNVDVEFYNPETGKTETCPFNQLENQYSGYLIYLQNEKKEETELSQIEGRKKQAAWFWNNFWRYRAIHSEVILASLLINIFSLIGPLYVMNVYDRVIPNKSEVTLWVLSSGVAVVFLFDFILRILRSYYLDVCNKKNDIVLVNLLFKRVLGMTLASKPASVGQFTNNFREFDSLRDFFSSTTLVAAIDLPFAILFLVLTWYLGGALVVVPLLGIIIITLSSVILAKPIQASVNRMTQGSARKNAVLVESLLGIEVLKCMNAEGLLQKRWETHVGDTARANFQSRFLSSILSSISYYSQQLVTIANLVIGFYLIYQGTLTIGGVIACNILSGRAIVPFIQLSNLLSRLQQSRQAMDSLGQIAALPQERQEGITPMRNIIKGNFQLNQVDFRYPHQKKTVIGNLSFKIKEGEKVAIIGRIGSGKSTILKLLMGLYSPEKGSITVEGLDIAQIDLIDLRRQIGYVPQDSLLFSGTVRENIAMAHPHAKDEDIQKVSVLAGVTAFVSQHPLGFNLHVGERGENLSGGQRQSITIARALIHDPPILFLDEPTSAMDNTSERNLLMALKEYCQSKTIIVTTHKFSMMSMIDRIIVIENGKAILDGPRDEVINAFNQQKQ